MSTQVNRTSAGPVYNLAVPATVGRDRRADVMRGLAVFGVVYIHSSNVVDLGRPPLLSGAGFGWCVPVFIILAGFFAARPPRTGPLPYWAQVGHRSLRLWVPFVAWTLVYFLAHRGWRGGHPMKIITRDFAGYGWSGQYYFVILIQAAFILPLAGVICIRRAWVVASFGLLLVWTIAVGRVHAWHGTTAGKLLDDRPVIFWVPDLLLGVWLTGRWKGRLAAPVSAVVGVGVVIGCTVLLAVAPGLSHERLTGPTPYQNPLVVLLAPVVFAGLATTADALPGAIARLVALAGRYSLGVFCLNPLVVEVAGRLLPSLAAGGTSAVASAGALVVPVAIAVAVTAVAVLVSVGLGRCGLARLVR